MEPIGDPDDAGDDTDFAEEHDDTTVDAPVGRDEDDGETESPEGWAGQD
jgi:hypothetical protein